MPLWEPRRADQLARGDIVLMEHEHLRVVTDVPRLGDGRVHVRLGSTWYALAPDREMHVDSGGSNGAAR
ncbi:hypothetical protein AB0I72_16505 [Nocardiopsis sp. NPDC049922]|uniref:hypothetical protein n=1 Tax=Nocardiopsis sp. NPDC049922 TaxID=3155157 RepID=UPI0033C21279